MIRLEGFSRFNNTLYNNNNNNNSGFYEYTFNSKKLNYNVFTSSDIN